MDAQLDMPPKAEEQSKSQLVLSATWEGHDDRVWSLAWQPVQANTTGTPSPLLASAGSDKKVKIWHEDSPSKWKCVCTLDEGHTKTIRHLSWSPHGTLLASASFDGTTCIWRKEIDE